MGTERDTEKETDTDLETEKKTDTDTHKEKNKDIGTNKERKTKRTPKIKGDGNVNGDKD